MAAVALREIRLYQRSADLILSKTSFQRLARDITRDLGHRDMRFMASALEAVQEAAEGYLVIIFESKYSACAIYCLPTICVANKALI